MERAMRARVTAAWNKRREMVSLLKNRHIPLKIRGGVYELCEISYVVWSRDMADEEKN